MRHAGLRRFSRSSACFRTVVVNLLGNLLLSSSSIVIHPSSRQTSFAIHLPDQVHHCFIPLSFNSAPIVAT